MTDSTLQNRSAPGTAEMMARQQAEAGRLAGDGLYDPSTEHEACGVGFIASLDGRPRRDVVLRAIEALKSVWHRGAVDADGKTGDGAGIHVQVPQGFFRECVLRTGHKPDGRPICVGQVFLPRIDHDAQEACRTIVEAELIRSGYYIYGWRQVPVDIGVIGEKANATRPSIEQIMFAAQSEGDALERDLFVIRRRIERRALRENITGFYICSFSARSLIYKGMFLAEQLAVFYPDLQDERFASAFAIYHQRYSTNTFPTWSRAQPFRTLAHNGEINTLKGNLNWLRSHEIRMASDLLGPHDADIKPLVQPGASDSAALDAVFEMLVHAGRSAPMAKTTLIPEAWSKKRGGMAEPLRHMYEYCNAIMEPWDGPAAIAATDGRWVIGGMDRNGLRPMRYLTTTDGLVIAGSECGLCAVDDRKVTERGRLGPGQMIGIDLAEGRFFHDAELKEMLANSFPFGKWAENLRDLSDEIAAGPEPAAVAPDMLRKRQLAAGWSVEDLELVLHPMVQDEKEAVGSMGDDTPLAVLSEKYRPLSHFFRQNFSQVTNPPIDPLREHRVMSLRTRFGNLQNVLADDAFRSEVVTLDSPVLSNGMFARLKKALGTEIIEIDCTFDIAAPEDRPGEALAGAMSRIRVEAAEAVRAGAAHLVLTDEHTGPGRAAIPMILATAGVHSHLVAQGLRTYTSLLVRSAECLDTHYFAVLIGCGATTVNAYLAQDSLVARQEQGLFGDLDAAACVRRYLAAVEAGLFKIMSKMGISVISSYRGGFNFEAVGLSRSLVDEFFPGVPSRISGIGLAGIEEKVQALQERAFMDDSEILPIGGLYRYRRTGETHALEGQVIHLLQNAVRTDRYEGYRVYVRKLQEAPPVNLRDLLDFKPSEHPVALDEVESINAIRKRFVTPGMSLGALSPEAHGTLNIAMNRIGAKSDSGEGGEDPERFRPLPNGDNANSAIKQIASGRFGVTAEYLNQAREIEIKIAQGAKPGEGGQLPGFKVTEMIARFRHSTPGVTLISPPPHHDIYSIEDLAQLIYDLKQINPDARVCVKLVSSAGIGTIAAGVAKAKADVILVSGHSGGTGASPLTSIKYAGVPWELGLSETNQVLTLNNLRHRVRLRTDGGIRTGRDVVIAAMLGAEEYGIGTASLLAMGCLMVRQCHTNTCPVGVCSQDEKLRERFTGKPEHVVNLFSFIAEDVREILASLGARSLDEVIGRTDLLTQVSRGAPHLDDLDLNPMLVQAAPGPEGRVCTVEGRNEVPGTLDAEIEHDAAPLLERGEKMQVMYSIRNTQRAIGARISARIVRKWGMGSLPPAHLTVRMHGSAGQSLGAFAVQGLKLVVDGEANDYVGKGLSGGTIVVRPGAESGLPSQDNTIIGNTVLYGATSGELFAAGQAGERFAVRNSGAQAVIEGCGSNGCEYMTGGTAVILGAVGDNFAAGMTGGMAFVFDTEERLPEMINGETVVWQRLASAHWEGVLKALIERHLAETGSAHAEALLTRWDLAARAFWQICPKELFDRLDHPLSEKSPRSKTRRRA
jgi:glutamate synthase (NADPH) large chain